MKLKHKEEYLTQEKRTAYLRELTPAQKDTLYKYKRYKINSELMTEINQDGTYWKLIYEEEYPYYNIHNPKDSPLICNCGKHVKHLFTCKASDSGEIRKFGRNHLQQEACIPDKVITQVRKMQLEIDRGTDTIISMYHFGHRFPIELYQIAIGYSVLASQQPKKQKMFQEFWQANLPLYKEDYDLLRSLIRKHKYQLKLIEKQKSEAQAKQIEKIKHGFKEELERQREEIEEVKYNYRIKLKTDIEKLEKLAKVIHKSKVKFKQQNNIKEYKDLENAEIEIYEDILDKLHSLHLPTWKCEEKLEQLHEEKRKGLEQEKKQERLNKIKEKYSKIDSADITRKHKAALDKIYSIWDKVTSSLSYRDDDIVTKVACYCICNRDFPTQGMHINTPLQIRDDAIKLVTRDENFLTTKIYYLTKTKHIKLTIHTAINKLIKQLLEAGIISPNENGEFFYNGN